MSDADSWSSSDAWFAATIASIGRRPTLERVITVGDAVNRSIFTAAEIERAVQRLVGSGLMEIPTGGEFRLTAAGTSLMRRRTGGLISQVASVQALLAEVELRTVPWSISQNEVDAAYRAYVASSTPRRRRRQS